MTSSHSRKTGLLFCSDETMDVREYGTSTWRSTMNNQNNATVLHTRNGQGYNIIRFMIMVIRTSSSNS